MVKYLENCVSRVYQGICHCWIGWEASPFNIFAVDITRNQSPGVYRSRGTTVADQSHRDLQSQQFLTTNFRCCANPHALTSKRQLTDKVLGLSWSAMLTRLSEIIANKPIKYLLKENKHQAGQLLLFFHTWVHVIWLCNKGVFRVYFTEIWEACRHASWTSS